MPLYIHPLFSSTVIVPPSASCRRMIGIPTPRFPVTDTEITEQKEVREILNKGKVNRRLTACLELLVFSQVASLAIFIADFVAHEANR